MSLRVFGNATVTTNQSPRAHRSSFAYVRSSSYRFNPPHPFPATRIAIRCKYLCHNLVFSANSALLRSIWWMSVFVKYRLVYPTTADKTSGSFFPELSTFSLLSDKISNCFDYFRTKQKVKRRFHSLGVTSGRKAECCLSTNLTEVV